MTEYKMVLDRARGPSPRLPLQAAPINRTLSTVAATCGTGVEASQLDTLDWVHQLLNQPIVHNGSGPIIPFPL
jgi:hypothetical protein